MQKRVAGLLAFKQMEFMEGMLCGGREREREKQPEENSRQAKQEGRQAVSGKSEGIKS